MSYTPPVRLQPLSPDALNRKVLLALEVFDPLSQTLVSSGLVVNAKGLGAPIVSWSGRFVWLDDGSAWPAEISVEAVRLPFEKEVTTPPKPPDLANAKPEQRLVRIVLRPTSAAEFTDVTAVRGRLCESLAAGAPPVTDASARLAWFDIQANVWTPASERNGVTNQAGEFAVFLRLQPATPDHEGDLMGRLLKVRLQFTRGSATRATPDNYLFLADPKAAGRVIEGELLARDLKLGWTNLQPI